MLLGTAILIALGVTATLSAAGAVSTGVLYNKYRVDYDKLQFANAKVAEYKREIGIPEDEEEASYIIVVPVDNFSSSTLSTSLKDTWKDTFDDSIDLNILYYDIYEDENLKNSGSYCYYGLNHENKQAIVLSLKEGTTTYQEFWKSNTKLKIKSTDSVYDITELGICCFYNCFYNSHSETWWYAPKTIKRINKRAFMVIPGNLSGVGSVYIHNMIFEGKLENFEGCSNVFQIINTVKPITLEYAYIRHIYINSNFKSMPIEFFGIDTSANIASASIHDIVIYNSRQIDKFKSSSSASIFSINADVETISAAEITNIDLSNTNIDVIPPRMFKFGGANVNNRVISVKLPSKKIEFKDNWATHYTVSGGSGSYNQPGSVTIRSSLGFGYGATTLTAGSNQSATIGEVQCTVNIA